MRPASVLLLAVTIGANSLLAACSGGGSRAQNLLVPVATGSGTIGSRTAHRVTHAVAQPYVYVADQGYYSGVIDVFHTVTYDELGWFTAGIAVPFDIFLDKAGNLYVANALGSDITEYAPGSWYGPSYTYSSGIKEPYGVVVDGHGNVYEADENDFNSGYVNEYFQRRNQPVQHCAMPGFSDAGIAVDTSGDVFISVGESDYSGTIYEYKGGLRGCQATALAVSGIGVYGIAVDKSGNLVLAARSSVEIVDAPGYNTVNRTIGSGFTCAENVHLNKVNTQAFVTDICNETVTVVNYSTGANEAVLGGYFGLQEPAAAVEHPNAVY